jgi:ribulose-5-phosphate 4-epimerase/fuculose-1-phosphate aldolase
MSIHHSSPQSDKVYIAPSGVQKERIEPAHIFVLPFPSPSGDRVFLRRPSLDLRESACTPLFWNAFDLRGAGSCIHTHSQNAVMLTLLTPGNMFRISHQVRDYVFSRIIFSENVIMAGGNYVVVDGVLCDVAIGTDR